MSKPLSLDLRERVVASVSGGMSRRSYGDELRSYGGSYGDMIPIA